ncbi:MAG: polysaccharide deacetylase family protein [Bryobacterales bacterium]
MMRRRDFLFAAAAAPKVVLSPGGRSIAVTVDDLPAARHCFAKAELEDFGSFRLKNKKFLDAFMKRKLPLTGFVAEGFTPKAWQPTALKSLLGDWLQAGAELGNHTFSHRDLLDVPMARFQADIVLGEAALGSALAERGKKPRYFRFPYLHSHKAGGDPRELERFLERSGYKTAPVTVDAQDWLFAEVYAWTLSRGDEVRRERTAKAYLEYLAALLEHAEQSSLETLGREPAQVLLMHASALSFDHVDEILRVIEGRGYRFVSLDEALRDEVYAEPAPPNGSWLIGWRDARKLPRSPDPEPGRFLGSLLEDYRLVQRTTPTWAAPRIDRLCAC